MTVFFFTSLLPTSSTPLSCFPPCQQSAFNHFFLILITPFHSSPSSPLLPFVHTVAYLSLLGALSLYQNHFLSPDSRFTPIFASTYHHGWGSLESMVHLSQSVCPLLCLGQGNRRGRGILPPRRTVSCHHENPKRRWWWCPRHACQSPGHCMERPQSVGESHPATHQMPSGWHRESRVRPP